MQSKHAKKPTRLQKPIAVGMGLVALDMKAINRRDAGREATVGGVRMRLV